MRSYGYSEVALNEVRNVNVELSIDWLIQAKSFFRFLNLFGGRMRTGIESSRVTGNYVRHYERNEQNANYYYRGMRNSANYVFTKPFDQLFVAASLGELDLR